MMPAAMAGTVKGKLLNDLAPADAAAAHDGPRSNSAILVPVSGAAQFAGIEPVKNLMMADGPMPVVCPNCARYWKASSVALRSVVENCRGMKHR